MRHENGGKQFDTLADGNGPAIADCGMGEPSAYLQRT
jgi:hypothetical protein